MEITETIEWLLSYYTAIAICIFVCYIAIMFGLYGRRFGDVEMKGPIILRFITFAILMAILWLPAFIIVLIKDYK